MSDYTPVHPATDVGVVGLAVADLERSIDFYERIIGLRTIDRAGETVTLGAGGVPILHLLVQANAQRQPQRSTGLYHVAILLPDRAALARTIRHLINTRYPIAGAADHLVSEAFYLDDPDGNGLELYRDRPRHEWTMNGQQVQMASDPVDLDGLFAEIGAESGGYTGMPDGTRVGHVHLRVGNIAQARQFYNGLLGFDVMADWPGALFVAAGGYHHHLGLNTWQSADAPAPPPNAVGLRYLTIRLPDEAARAQVMARLQAASIPLEQQDDAVALHDPWQNQIRLTL